MASNMQPRPIHLSPGFFFFGVCERAHSPLLRWASVCCQAWGAAPAPAVSRGKAILTPGPEHETRAGVWRLELSWRGGSAPTSAPHHTVRQTPPRPLASTLGWWDTVPNHLKANSERTTCPKTSPSVSCWQPKQFAVKFIRFCIRALCRSLWSQHGFCCGEDYGIFNIWNNTLW